MKTVSVVLLLVVVCCTHVAHSVNPSVRIAATNSALDELTSTITPIIEKTITNVPLPNLEGSVHLPEPAGRVEWWITDVKIPMLQFTNNHLKTIPGVGVQYTVTNSGGEITCGWKWRKKHIVHASDHGTATVTMSDLDINLKIEIGIKNERGTAVARVVSVDLGKFKIKISSKVDWVYNMFLTIFNKNLRESVQTATTNALINLINENMNHGLQSSNIYENLGPKKVFSIALTEAVSFQTAFFSIPMDGGIYPRANPTQRPPFAPAPIPVTGDQMMTFSVADYTFNSGLYLDYKDGAYNSSLNGLQNPNATLLNTNGWKITLRPLYTKYPDTPLRLDLSAYSAPSIDISAGGFKVNFVENVAYYPLMSNGSAPLALTLRATFNTTVNFYLQSNKLIGNMTMIDMKFSVVSSNIGDVSVAVLNTSVNTALKQVVLPLLNKRFNEGIQLPKIPFIEFKDAQIRYFNRYMIVGGNVTLGRNSGPMW